MYYKIRPTPLKFLLAKYLMQSPFKILAIIPGYRSRRGISRHPVRNTRYRHFHFQNFLRRHVRSWKVSADVKIGHVLVFSAFRYVAFVRSASLRSLPFQKLSDGNIPIGLERFFSRASAHL
jgi:hypothetical protein